jgi:DNA-binding response OmpR family regulator
MHAVNRSNADDGGSSIALARAVRSPEGESTHLLGEVRSSELMLKGLLPAIGEVRREARALGTAGKRGDLAERVARIDELAGDVETSTRALAHLIAFESHESPLDLSMVDLGDVLMSLLARWKNQAPTHDFELALPGEIPLVSAETRCAETALNALIEEALALTAPGGSIRVSIRPEADSVEIALRPHTPVWLSVSAKHDETSPRGASHDAEARSARARINAALAQVIVARHGGRTWLEHDAEGEGVTLRASWRCSAQADDNVQPGHEVQSGGVRIIGAVPRSHAANAARQTVLVGEPDARMARYLRSNLELRQFRPIMASTLDEVPRLIEAEEPDVLVLDAADADRAFAMVGRVIHLTEAPVILLAPEYEAEACARLLDAGASDYIAKPLHIDELFARMRVALRGRRTPDAVSRAEPTFRSGDLTIEFAQRRVTVGGCEIALSKTEFSLLRTLAQNAGKVLSHEWLLERVWGAGYRHETDFVWVYVRRLRRKIEPDPKHPHYVITVPGVGYRLAKT